MQLLALTSSAYWPKKLFILSRIKGDTMMGTRHLYKVIFPGMAGIILCMICSAGLAASPERGRVERNTKITERQNSVKSLVHLYFADRNNSYLEAEERDLLHANNPVEFGKAIVEALIDGPRTQLMRTLPAGSKLKAFYITGDGTAYVDMSDEIKEGHPGGVKSELFTIYSVVDSLALNIPEIEAVKFLINGKESMTLNGHIDLRFPFKANLLLIR
jgi:spore germination protein GerM